MAQISYGSSNQRSPKKVQSEPPSCNSEDTSAIQEKMSSLDPKTASPADFVNVVKGLENKVVHKDSGSEKPSMCSNPDSKISNCKEPSGNNSGQEKLEKTENETLSTGGSSEHGLYTNMSGAGNNCAANQGTEASHAKEGADLESCTHNIVASDRHWCKKELHDLVGRVYPPLVVREMLILQTGMPGMCKIRTSEHAPSPSVLHFSQGAKQKSALLSEIICALRGLLYHMFCTAYTTISNASHIPQNMPPPSFFWQGAKLRRKKIGFLSESHL